MRRLMVCGALALLLLGGCTVAPAPYYDRPYAAPSYGQWRWDDDLGLYVSIGSPYLYYADHTYYRWSDRYWIAAPRYNGPWRTIDRRQVPSRLERRYYPGYPGRRMEESQPRFEQRVEPYGRQRSEQLQWRGNEQQRERSRTGTRQEWREREQRRQSTEVPRSPQPTGVQGQPRRGSSTDGQRRWQPATEQRHSRERASQAGERRTGHAQQRSEGGRRKSAPQTH